MRGKPVIDEVARMTVDAANSLFEWFALMLRKVEKALRKLAKEIDRRWLRRYRRALARSRRNNQYLKSIGRCR